MLTAIHTLGYNVKSEVFTSQYETLGFVVHIVNKEGGGDPFCLGLKSRKRIDIGNLKFS